MNSSAMEDLIADLAADPAEAALMLGAVRLLPFAAEPHTPPPTLFDRIKQRIDRDQRGPTFEAAGSYFAQSERMGWLPYAPGIQVKLLYNDPATHSQTVMVKMEPNCPFPPHGHPGDEDLYLIEGDAWVGDVPMRAGDYCRAPEGSAHNDVRAGEMGALAIVVTR